MDICLGLIGNLSVQGTRNGLTDCEQVIFTLFIIVRQGLTGRRSACHSAESLLFMNIIAWGPQVRQGPNFTYISASDHTYAASFLFARNS